MRDSLNGYKREFILENLKFFCLAICPGIPASARAFGSQMLEFKKSLEEDLQFKRLEYLLKADIALLSDTVVNNTDKIIKDIEYLKQNIKPEFFVENPIDVKEKEKEKLTFDKAINTAILAKKSVNALKKLVLNIQQKQLKNPLMLIIEN